jgi:catechol 2,3-dioxygenase-like lactoylglutathione lyase family enzyme
VTSNGGLPGLRGGDHIGLTVPDLDEAERFFVDIIGCTPFYEIGPIASDDGWMSRQLGVDDRAVVKRLKFLRCGAGLNIELFEYVAPDQNRAWPRNSDWGGFHIALYVDDFSAALAHLKAAGVTVLGEPVVRTEGPSAGTTWIYVQAPWGLTLELVSFPEGKGYERQRSERLWHPAHPSD